MRLLLILISLLAWGAPPSDLAVEQEIREKFSKSKISSNKFTVKVRNGVATLEGNSGVIQHKGAATRLAKSGGAREVVNNIQVSEEAKRKARESLAEGRKKAAERKAQAKSAAATQPAPKRATPPLASPIVKQPAAAQSTPPAAAPLKRAQVIRR